MLRSCENLRGYTLLAHDGEIGRCRDFLFDDDRWTIRYMVADTRKWLPGRKVLISPISLRAPNWKQEIFPVDLDREQIKNAPPIDEAAPVSREQERIWAMYYGYGSYWMGAYTWGAVPLAHDLRNRVVEEEEQNLDPARVHIRSCSELMSYHAHATDGLLGRVVDFVLDDVDWKITDLLIDTGRALHPGQRVFVPPARVTSVDWANRTVSLSASKEELIAASQASASPDEPQGLTGPGASP